ncbi:MAG: hypothetical protein M1831_003354 [Alyxoria varia]|nr:MAG: hypothetical protein M1831_003354 [Alyxoria varia]
MRSFTWLRCIFWLVSFPFIVSNFPRSCGASPAGASDQDLDRDPLDSEEARGARGLRDALRALDEHFDLDQYDTTVTGRERERSPIPVRRDQHVETDPYATLDEETNWALFHAFGQEDAHQGAAHPEHQEIAPLDEETERTLDDAFGHEEVHQGAAHPEHQEIAPLDEETERTLDDAFGHQDVHQGAAHPEHQEISFERQRGKLSIRPGEGQHDEHDVYPPLDEDIDRALLHVFGQEQGDQGAGHDRHGEPVETNDPANFYEGTPGNILPSPSSTRSPPGPTGAAIAPSLIRGYLADAIWKDASGNFRDLPDYPDQQEVDQLLQMLHDQFFRRFQTQQVLESTPIEFRFGTKDQFSFRIIWHNPKNKVYPRSLKNIPRGYAINPEDHLVYNAPNSKWNRGNVDRPLPLHRGPAVESYNHERLPRVAAQLLESRSRTTNYPYDPMLLPTLSDYLQMRLMSRDHETGMRWGGGMGATLMSFDFQFAFAYRIWLYATDMPRDKPKVLLDRVEHNLMYPVVTELYHGVRLSGPS